MDRSQRRLSKLPVPIPRTRTRVPSTFTASPLTQSYVNLHLSDHDESENSLPLDDQLGDESPAKKIRGQQSRPKPLGIDNRRMSLAPRQDSLLATPPLRKMAPRKSLAPNPYGMHSSEKTSRRRSFNGSNRIVVCVRKRPLSEKEASNSQDSIGCNVGDGSVSINAVRTKLDGLSKFEEQHTFRFDKVFDENADNLQVYHDTLSPLVQHTCKGSGKTHTMFNEPFGLCYQAAKELFDLAPEFDVYVSFYEIYQGQLMDLLRNRRRIVACEKDGVVNILGLEEEKCQCVEDLMEAVKRGLQTRVTGTTGANAQSSRSHAVLNYSLRPRKDQLFGRISFIDLAGSERGADRQNASKTTKLEGSEINKSLLALKECIRAMDLDSSRIPFRQSKLTMVLRDSFLGNSRTCMIATVSPSSSNVEHSLNTLRYADRMKESHGTGEGPGETVTQLDYSTPSVHQPFTKPEHNRPTNTPTSVEQQPACSASSSVTIAKARLKRSLVELTNLISECDNLDVLELLQEELAGLKSAFSTLA